MTTLPLQATHTLQETLAPELKISRGENKQAAKPLLSSCCHSSPPHYSLCTGQPPSSQQRGKYQYSISTWRAWNSLVPSKANSRALHTFQRNLGKADKRQGREGRMSGSCSQGSWARGQHLQEAWGTSELSLGSSVCFWEVKTHMRKVCLVLGSQSSC